MQQLALTVYGHPRCPMVVPVRHLLNHSAIAYTYINIHDDADARHRVKELNAGNETVPTLVFADGTILREPRIRDVQAKLVEVGIHVPPGIAFYVQHSLWLVLVGFLLVGSILGKVLGSAVLGGVGSFIVGFVVNDLRIRRAGA